MGALSSLSPDSSELNCLHGTVKGCEDTAELGEWALRKPVRRIPDGVNLPKQDQLCQRGGATTPLYPGGPFTLPPRVRPPLELI